MSNCSYIILFILIPHKNLFIGASVVPRIPINIDYYSSVDKQITCNLIRIQQQRADCRPYGLKHIFHSLGNTNQIKTYAISCRFYLGVYMYSYHNLLPIYIKKNHQINDFYCTIFFLITWFQSHVYYSNAIYYRICCLGYDSGKAAAEIHLNHLPWYIYQKCSAIKRGQFYNR